MKNNMKFKVNIDMWTWMNVFEFACSQPVAKCLTREMIVDAVYEQMMKSFPEKKTTWDEYKKISLMAATTK